MSLVEMQKLKLVGLKSEESVIFDILTRSRLFEPREGDPLEGAAITADRTHLDGILSMQARCAFAISKLGDSVKEAAKKAKKNADFAEYSKVKTGGRIFDDWSKLDGLTEKKETLFAAIDDIEQLSFYRAELRASRNKMSALIRGISVYRDCTEKFTSFKNTDKCESLLVSGKYHKDFYAKLGEFPVYINEYTSSGYNRVYGIIYLKQDADDIKSVLSDFGFTACPYGYDETAAGQISLLRGQIDENLKEDDGTLLKILAYADALPELKTLYDSLYIEADKSKAKLGYYATDETCVFEGWLPKPEAERIAGSVKEKTENIEIYLTDAEKEENPPTLYKQNTVLAPYQSIADSYSPPAYGEFDPGWFTAFFFFLFFGMLTADAGYGLILSLGALIIVKVLKPTGGFKSLIMLIGISAISAIVWGLLFGSVFGLDFSQLGGIFGLDLPMAIWFNPLDTESGGPMMLLIISLLFGILHLMCGYCIHFYKQTKSGHLLDAIFDDGLMIVAYIGVFMLLMWMGVGLLNIALLPVWFEIFLTPGLILLLVGIGGVVLTRGRKKKGIMGKIVSGAGGLYELINILSDVLSYARIFGIALASCAIGLAFNTLIELVASIGPIGIVFAVILAVVLHVFNLAMGVLSSYVHNSRLQYLEFFGKFYDGGGRLFAPLGGKTKYIILRG